MSTEYTETTHQIGKYSIFSRLYSVSSAKGNILFIHGYTEHSGINLMTGKYFNEQGFNVYFIDLPGHGRSSGTRGYIPLFEDYEMIVKEFSKLIQKSDVFISEQLPLYLIGFSIGGLIVSRIASDEKASQLYNAIISINPPYWINVWYVYIFYYFALVFAFFFPSFTVHYINESLFNNKEVASKFFKDPYLLKSNNLHVCLEMVRVGIEDIRKSEHVPFLLIQSSCDSIVNPKGALTKSHYFHDSKSLFVLIPNQNHMLFEEDFSSLHSTMTKWIDSL
ncbi:hypothetical protein ENUP19_0188G0026 [Entamoeba nuttalli]|uniref:Hydrolase, alpha/beta fold family domain containing protein n=2 Tax=Entamoeba nuttalli TaxID=412467 RepID=K2H6F5_ENTNP|nr:hydrolase, alpha/beta fold family domain containing protein [Entamoeba nuttalli P19]EKE42077.1 hydrolase, alpha/beta fold family domain containing protein [Entamoeba nuttalli P19]|eukprot:XP_008855588.1 hydrolase, alpha/beta fold family domain containing protein [Entamoeba nuttalli P19]